VNRDGFLRDSGEDSSTTHTDILRAFSLDDHLFSDEIIKVFGVCIENALDCGD
jgi:hypothetical protein